MDLSAAAKSSLSARSLGQRSESGAGSVVGSGAVVVLSEVECKTGSWRAEMGCIVHVMQSYYMYVHNIRFSQ